VMDVVYEFANMLDSRDSFLGNRMQTLLQTDISDTLWTNRQLTLQQTQLLSSLGADLVSRLSFYFSNDPVLQRADVSQAKIIHLQNLRSLESLFAKNVFNNILKIDCGIFGGPYCSSAKNLDPVATSIFSNNSVDSLNQTLNAVRQSRWGSGGPAPTEDSQAHRYIRAKLCVQSLAFETREKFKEICKGATLISEFSDENNLKGLNVVYDNALETIASIRNSNLTGKIDISRGAGVCAFRSYLRKNHIFRMYQEYRSRDTL
jgi:hypothetical protein